MAKYKIFNKTENVITPIGEVLSASEWLERYPWANIDGVKMIISGSVINGALALEFESTKDFYTQQYGETWVDCVTDQDVLNKMEYWDNYTPASTGESTAQERIAAALEYQNALASPVVNTDDPDAN